jgi:hypothetical protein
VHPFVATGQAIIQIIGSVLILRIRSIQVTVTVGYLVIGTFRSKSVFMYNPCFQIGSGKHMIVPGTIIVRALIT